jgi:transcriptional regulator with GAF, ATPase, and Fis domain
MESGDVALIADSAKMRQVLRQVERFGRYRWPVLLLGETGTGKEVIARAA